MVKLIHILLEIFCYASTGFLPTIAILELCYTVCEILIALEVGELIKVLSSSWWTGT